MMNVKHILSLKGSTAVETIEPDARVRDAAAVLGRKGYGALMVVGAGGEIAGILSERDIVRVLGRDGPGCLDQPVSALMTARVVSCAPTDTAQSVMERMTEGRFRHMPVMEDGRMTGLLSIGDVVKARIQEMEMENSAMVSMLHG